MWARGATAIGARGAGFVTEVARASFIPEGCVGVGVWGGPRELRYRGAAFHWRILADLEVNRDRECWIEIYDEGRGCWGFWRKIKGEGLGGFLLMGIGEAWFEG